MTDANQIYTYKNIVVGQTYKSYRQLCEALNAKVESGNSKKAQFRDWECYFAYTKQGNKFIITEIFNSPKEREDLRSLGKNSVYADFIQLLILDYLANCDGHLVVGKNRLMQTIGIINRNYSECQASLRKLAEYTGVDIKVVYDFYNTTNSSFRTIVEYNLNKLVDKRIIMYDTVTKVKMTEEKYTSVATPYQKQQILKVEKELLDDMGYDNMSKIRVSSDWLEYKKQVDNKLRESLGINFYFKAYDISINTEYLVSERKKLVEYILDKAERINKKEDLNNLVISNVNKNAHKRNEDSFNSPKKSSQIRNKDTYTEDIGQLASLLLNINSAHLTSEIMKINMSETLTEDKIKDIEDSLCF